MLIIASLGDYTWYKTAKSILMCGKCYLCDRNNVFGNASF